jgi:hypothetical protein
MTKVPVRCGIQWTPRAKILLLVGLVGILVALGVSLGLVLTSNKRVNGDNVVTDTLIPEEGGADAQGEEVPPDDSDSGTTDFVDESPTAGPASLRGIPSDIPSSIPSASPSSVPTGAPSIPPIRPIEFYTIADVPYNDLHRQHFPDLVSAVPESADFLIHLGDIKDSSPNCDIEYVQYIDSILSTYSKVPTLLIIGDNEYNDCRRPTQALEDWRAHFTSYESKHWTPSFETVTMPDRPESFTFHFQSVLFFGLNIVGGDVHSGAEWRERLSSQFDWMTGIINDTLLLTEEPTNAIVIFGHSNPGERKSTFFFNPLRDYVENELQNAIPIIYISADKHKWEYEETFLKQPSILRVTVGGGVDETPIQFIVNGTDSWSNEDLNEIFVVSREWGSNYTYSG